jgi:hypothetical protein
VGSEDTKPDIHSIPFHLFCNILPDESTLGIAGSTFCKNIWTLPTRTDRIRRKRILPEIDVETQGDERMSGDTSGSVDNMDVSRVVRTGIKKLMVEHQPI